MKITIQSDNASVIGTIQHEVLAAKLTEEFPIETVTNTWGEEVYFEVPVDMEVESDAREVVDAGTITFWVQGSALAIPFGPTPASHEDECRLITAVNPVGELLDDPDQLSHFCAGEEVTITAADE